MFLICLTIFSITDIRNEYNLFFFSREGALNLLRDFEGVSEWITKCKDVLPEHVEILSKHEVLRTCEGVGKILLRKPFEIIPMSENTPRAQPQKSGGSLFPVLSQLVDNFTISIYFRSRK